MKEIEKKDTPGIAGGYRDDIDPNPLPVCDGPFDPDGVPRDPNPNPFVSDPSGA